MQEEPKKYEALFAEWSGRKLRITITVFRADDDSDAVEIAGDHALLDGTELTYLRNIG